MVIRLIVPSLLLACGDAAPTGDETAAPAPAGVVELAPVDLLTRASLDLRGVRPSVDEIAQVEADPAVLDALIDDYLHDERFGQRVMDLFAEVYLTRTESYAINFTPYDLDGVPTADLYRSIGEEPLRILAHVAENDLPITELVTADWTLANEVLAAMWPLDYPEGETGWKQVHYTDQRPAAGVLATNGLWWRYMSTDSNANRKRANVASRLFLCHDYLTRPIDFDRNINLLDEEAVLDALQNDPSCVNCHVSLDPLAAHFFGFWWYNPDTSEVASYHPSRELSYADYLGVAPGYYGEPTTGLADLGREIAGDNRFPECMVEHVTELLLRRDAELLDFERMTEHREALLAGGLALRPLFRSVLESPEYRAATDEGLPGTQVPLKMATPELLASQVEDLTGYRWTYDGYDLLTSELVGFLTLAGGADGTYAVKNATSPNTTLLLVQERLAEAGAEHIVTQDLEDPSAARLFVEIDFTETPETDRGAMVAQLQHLHLRLFGHRVAPDGPEVEANLELWQELHAVEDDVPRAWMGVLSALLRDPDLLFY